MAAQVTVLVSLSGSLLPKPSAAEASGEGAGDDRRRQGDHGRTRGNSLRAAGRRRRRRRGGPLLQRERLRGLRSRAAASQRGTRAQKALASAGSTIKCGAPRWSAHTHGGNARPGCWCAPAGACRASCAPASLPTDAPAGRPPRDGAAQAGGSAGARLRGWLPGRVRAVPGFRH
jgi:hypothetical protein